jgi:hypothetical protein
MGALKELIDRDDQAATDVIRAYPGGHPNSIEAAECLRHNERFRNWFRQALKDEEDFPLA